jgi:subtilase family serine protease
MVVGGTSAVAPLYAGLFAAFGRKLGFVTPKLWANHLCFTDITQGDNGFYRARVGPDPCTGLGSPIGSKLAALLTAPVGAAEPGLSTALDSLVPAGWSGVLHLTFVNGRIMSEERREPTAIPVIENRQKAPKRGRRRAT